MSLDRYGRTIDYLRISLTDMCNLRCVYCMPEDMTFRPGDELLSDGEILRLAGLFAELGFRKFRFTGGEPTLRSGLVDIVRRVAALHGVEELAMTTNGIRLGELARPLAEAGLQRVNVSIDSLDQRKFKQMTRWGNLKLNAVIVRNFNDAEDAVELAALTKKHPWQVRFIEMMPFGGISEFQQKGVVTEDDLVGRFSKALGPLELLDGGALDGEARRYRFAGAPGTLGFISPVSRPFCAGCNRVRLTADGKLRLCLLREREIDLRAALRSGVLDEELRSMITDAIWEKPWGHALSDDQFPGDRTMSEIGG